MGLDWGGAARLPLAVKRVLQQGLTVHDRFVEGAITRPGLLLSAGRPTARRKRVLDGRFRRKGNRRLANFLSDHLSEVFAYLRHPGMAAGNYRGEQSIRPAVVHRKVWGGNHTWQGARAQSVLMPVIGTDLTRCVDPLRFLIQTLISPQPTLLPQPSP